MNDRIIKIPNMSCEHCVRTIETELSELECIQSAKADLESKSVSVSLNDASKWDNVLELLKEINYPPAD